jgi:hypothetical protein
MDSFQGVNSEPVTLHKYLYGNADSVNGIDPSGFLTIASVNTAVSIVGQQVARATAVSTAAGFSFIGGTLAGDGFLNNGKLHQYQVEHEICQIQPGIQSSRCNPETVFEGLLRFPAPGFSGVPIFNGQISWVQIGNVEHRISDLKIRNITLEGHLLHPGIAERKVVVKNNRIVVETFGSGFGPLPVFNTLFSDSLWNWIDSNIVDYVHQR